MVTARARVPSSDNGERILPLAIPDLLDVRQFACQVHSAGKAWTGQVFGWPAEYTPESRKRPVDSKMRFTPAMFCIGESGIWFTSLMWEEGKSSEPACFLDDRGILK